MSNKPGEIPIFWTFLAKNRFFFQFWSIYTENPLFESGHVWKRHFDVIHWRIFMILVSMERGDPTLYHGTKQSYFRLVNFKFINPFLSAHIPCVQSDGILPQNGIPQWLAYIFRSTQRIATKLYRNVVEASSLHKKVKYWWPLTSRDPRWPPNTFLEVKFWPINCYNSAILWTNLIISFLCCC